MLLKYLSLLIMLTGFGGCAWFNEPLDDFNKPLIVLPQDTQTNAEIDSKSNDTKPPEQQAWVEAKTSRIWVNPHIDENGDYVQGYYKYIVLEQGHWSLNGNQANNR